MGKGKRSTLVLTIQLTGKCTDEKTANLLLDEWDKLYEFASNKVGGLADYSTSLPSSNEEGTEWSVSSTRVYVYKDYSQIGKPGHPSEAYSRKVGL